MSFFNILNKALPNLQVSHNNSAGSGWANQSFFFSDEESTYWYIVTYTNEYAFKKVNFDWLESNARLLINSSKIFVAWNDKHRITYWLAVQGKAEPGNMKPGSVKKGNQIKKLKQQSN
ncbi:MAG: hypothetical protein VR69_06260 [Peptococcaceae bacterium BRH_c4b]|nr:MAG: hypothetical protein VR69_06260 [Peptococcaceae bacterium BRH_c4b]